jgi:hypothetical protein
MSRLRLAATFCLLLAPLALLAGCDNTANEFVTPTTPTGPTGSPVTEVFASQIFVGGSSARSFTAAQAGTASATLTSVSVPAGTKIGFGMGVPDTLGSGCLFTRSLDAVAGDAITLSVDAGTYCVRVYDLGTLTANASFSITIVRP